MVSCKGAHVVEDILTCARMAPRRLQAQRASALGQAQPRALCRQSPGADRWQEVRSAGAVQPNSFTRWPHNHWGRPSSPRPRPKSATEPICVGGQI
jgi:hypothetical protein